MTHDYHGPCLILLDRSTTVDVRRGGRIESVSMPTPMTLIPARSADLMDFDRWRFSAVRS